MSAPDMSWTALPYSAPAFVDRTQELARLRQAWDRARVGQRQLVFVSGDAGIGKTRLITGFAAAAGGEGATLLYGWCDEEPQTSYQPLVAALQSYVTTASIEELRLATGKCGGALTRLLPTLGARLPNLPAPIEGDADSARVRLFDAVSSFLIEAARLRPLVLLLDDLHWADRPTLQLLKHLVRTGAQSPLLILGSYCEELTGTHPLAQTLADLRAESSSDARLFERVLLQGFDDDATSALISAVVGHAAPPDLIHTVYELTAGNPLFIEQVLHDLVETGVLYRRNGGWSTNLAIEELSMPRGVREVIGRRLSRLSEACNAVLGIAAVIGREFDLSVLEQAVAQPAATVSADRLSAALQEAVAVDIVREVPQSGERFSFTHALIRETLYSMLTTTQRVQLHRRVGEAIEATHAGEPAAQLGALAYHFMEAVSEGDVDKAIDYATRAAQQASDVCAYEQAAGGYQRAVHALDLNSGDPMGHPAAADDGQRYALLLRLGEVQCSAGEADKAKRTLARAADIAKRLSAM